MEATLGKMFPTVSAEVVAEVARTAGTVAEGVEALRKKQADRIPLEHSVVLPSDAGWGAATHAVPMPIALVTAVDASGGVNVCTVGAWGLANGAPRMFGVGFCEREAAGFPGFWRRATSAAVDETGEFVINVPHMGLNDAWIAAASRSRTKEPTLDKLALAGLTPRPSRVVRAPIVAECGVCVECVVRQRLSLPTHDWVVGEAVAIHVAAGADPRVLSYAMPQAPTLALNH